MKNLNDLREIQRAIQEAVQTKQNPLVVDDILADRPPLSVQKRLEIYQEGYDARLEGSLRDDFERIQTQLGSDDQFEKIIQKFILLFPSNVRNIAEYSEDFVIFVKNLYPELYDSALCDWYSLVAAKMPDVTQSLILSMQEVQQGVPFKVRTFFSTMLFRSNKKHYTTFRKQDEIHTQEISSADYDLIQFLKKSQSVDDFVEKAQSLKIEDGDVAKKINEWITNQVIYCERI